MALARAATELDAANEALAAVRQLAIANFDEPNVRAREARKHFGTVRDGLLAEHDWNFAKAFVVPAGLAPDALGRLKKRYAMPEDCISVRGLEPADDAGYGKSWDIEANPDSEAKILVTNRIGPTVRYTRRIAIVKLWDAQFLAAFELLLAAAIAPVLAKDSTLAAELAGEANAIVDQARLTDARENSKTHISRDTSWLRARR